jgi:hypothetical protein
MSNNHPNRGGSSTHRTPEPAEIVSLQVRLDWTDPRCADACCVSVETWRSWVMGRWPMPVGAWKLFRLEAGIKPGAQP